VDTRGGTRRDVVARAQRPAAQRVTAQREGERGQRTAAHRSRGAAARHGAIDACLARHGIRRARLPVGHLGAEQQAGVVAEIARDHGGTVVVDVLQRAARDLDADVHRAHEAPRGFGRPLRDVRGGILRELEHEFGLDGRETLREDRRIMSPARLRALHRSVEDRAHQALRAIFRAVRLGDPADLPARDGVIPECDRLVLAAIGGGEVGWLCARIARERARGAARVDEFGGHTPGIEREAGDNGNQFSRPSFRALYWWRC
jgi:hypothetical protein